MKSNVTCFCVGVDQYGPFKASREDQKRDEDGYEVDDKGVRRVIPFAQFADPAGGGLFVAVAAEGVTDLPTPNVVGTFQIEVVPDSATGGKRGKYRYLGLAASGGSAKAA